MIPEALRCPVCKGRGETPQPLDPEPLDFLRTCPVMGECDGCLGTGRVVCKICGEARATHVIDMWLACEECAAEMRREIIALADAEMFGRNALNRMAIDLIKRAAAPALFVLAAIVQQVVTR